LPSTKLHKVWLMQKLLLMVGAVVAASMTALGQTTPRPDAPPLALRGKHSVGVRTLQLEDTSRKRPLTVEVWYPAKLAANQTESTIYKATIGATKFDMPGKAARDAALETGKFPLVLVSHGQAGSRYMMTYLTEHLASQGFVVAALDHTGSTYDDITQAAYISSLVDRPLDMLFSIDAVSKVMSNADSQNVALLGYSYGGYTALNAAGIGLDKANLETYCKSSNNEGPCFALPFFDGLVAARGAGVVKADPRVKAVFVMAPYGVPWLSAKQLESSAVPLFVGCGEADDIATYKRDSRTAFTSAGTPSKYLLSLQSASHNAWTNDPPASVRNNWTDFERWFEPAWDRERLNDITKHFATAFLQQHVEKNTSVSKYLTSALEGFRPRTTIGIKLEVGK
jgi:predicted dienelactone hydrolase